MLKEFKKFIARGNVIDLAVGVIIGAAFTAIVQSLVTNLINPLIGLFVGRMGRRLMPPIRTHSHIVTHTAPTMCHTGKKIWRIGATKEWSFILPHLRSSRQEKISNANSI